jgi:hypothetical protein
MFKERGQLGDPLVWYRKAAGQAVARIQANSDSYEPWPGRSVSTPTDSAATAGLAPVDEYRSAAPNPLQMIAPGVLHHLEKGPMADLIRCVRAHGMTMADWVIPPAASTVSAWSCCCSP